MRKLSTSSSNLVDPSAPDNKPSHDSNSSNIPHHGYFIESLATRRQRTDTSTFSFYARSSDSAAGLLKQHAETLSSDTHSSELFPQLYLTQKMTLLLLCLPL